MSECDYGWCRDVRRDEAVRAAEDAAAVPAIQHRDLPEALAALTERVARLEAAQATLGSGDEIARLTAERDAAIRERDEARAECERLREAQVKAARERDRANEARGRIRKDWERRGKSLHASYATIGRLNARIAALESGRDAAPATNAGGEQQPPRGWLTEEMRDDLDEALEWLNCQTNVFAKRAAAAIATTLARETPPMVKVPSRHVIITTVDARERIDRQWIAAIRAAGGEVE